MAKDNMLLGFARGSVGDVTFTRLAGQQVARARNRHPSNPQTMLQLTQRSTLKTVSSAFSFFSPICDHSFEGQSGTTANQSRYAKLNVAMLRSNPDVVDVLESGEEEDFLASAAANFAGKQTYGCEINPYVVSEGSLNWTGSVQWDASHVGFKLLGFTFDAAMTYAQFVSALGLMRGDQLTIVQVTCDDTEAGSTGRFNGMQVARIILDPSTGDMTAPLYAQSGDSYIVASPNERNDGIVQFTSDGSVQVRLSPGEEQAPELRSGLSVTICGMAVIASRQSGGTWLRSSASLVLRPWTSASGSLAWDHGTDYLGHAIRSFLPSTDSRSLLYLNQATNESL